jgi:3'(2'), 5'-bisphosphate nucleotidase
MNLEETERIVNSLIGTFILSGNVSLDLRNKGLKKKIKSDNTPVTNGDIQVNDLLTKKITDLTPNIKIISEENLINKENKNLKDFWLIDPIDGTYDYINGKDEFTINAALILNKKPVAGIINAPDKNRLFYSFGLANSFELSNKSKTELACKKKSKDNEINAVAYSNNPKPEITAIYKKYNITNFTRMKSSLKFCVIASGEFDFYAAEPRAYEWDIAAGHAILEHAGGTITDFDGSNINYGKKDFKNPSLILKRGKIL